MCHVLPMQSRQPSVHKQGGDFHYFENAIQNLVFTLYAFCCIWQFECVVDIFFSKTNINIIKIQLLTKKDQLAPMIEIGQCHLDRYLLLAPSGALVVIIVYYIHTTQFFKIFKFFRF